MNWKINFLLGLGKDYETSGFSFTLSGKSDTTLLYEDIELKKKWDAVCKTDREIENEKTFAQCAITGEEEPIARIHGKIKGSIWWSGNRKCFNRL